jgi:hypothetical protein
VSVLPARARVRFRKAWRIIRSIYPPADLFDDIADPADWELLASAEAKTNPRLRDQIGEIRLVPPERRVSGPGASWVMAAFTHVSPLRPSRFSDGSYGVYYMGDRFEVALAETVYHFQRFMRATNEEPATADFRELVGRLDAELHDLRRDARFADCLDPDPARYPVSQALARTLRDAHASDGIVYPSVRWPKGFAAAAFWPDVVGLPVQGRHLSYRWNGARADAYFLYGEEDWIPLDIAPPPS